MKKIGCAFIALILFVIAWNIVKTSNNQTLPVLSPQYNRTVILDAGHGGEDGGAVAPDNTNEKDINLQISNKIASYFSLFGVPFVTVRTQDASVGDNGLKTVRERKRSDILNREKLVNSYPDSVFLSIHQNMFSASKYYGTQVFYSANQEDSAVLAEKIRSSVISGLQPENTRECKPSGKNIYLLYYAKTTAVMVECGFLSNQTELIKLKSEHYQSQMAYYICKGLLNYFNEERRA